MIFFPWWRRSTPDNPDHTRRILETASLASRLAALAEVVAEIDEGGAGESGRRNSPHA